jgi:hypothetical protein
MYTNVVLILCSYLTKKKPKPRMADIEETGVLLRMNSSSSGSSSSDSKGAILTSDGLATGTFDQR